MRGKRLFCFLFLLILICASVSAVSIGWFRSTLNEGQRNLYDRIGEAVLNCEPKIYDVKYDMNECLRIYSGYLDDHPGIFWASTSITHGYEIINGKKVYSMGFQYTHQDNLNADKNKFVKLVDQFSSNLEDATNDWIKLYHIYSYLSKSIKYSTDYMDQSMWSVFFEGIGVCAGFARSFQYLALLEDIPSVVVHGWQRLPDGSAGERHLWVMAKVGDQWYHFDPTWGLMDSDGIVDYTYFCRSRSRMEKTHIIDEKYPIPVAKDDSMSYVSMRHRFIRDYSYETFSSIVKDAVKRGEKSFTVEFKHADELENACTDLFTNRAFNRILNEQKLTDVLGYTYSKNPMSASLKITLR